jgi:hypothetical protein
MPAQANGGVGQRRTGGEQGGQRWVQGKTAARCVEWATDPALTIYIAAPGVLVH